MRLTRRRWLRWIIWSGAALLMVALVGPFLLPLPPLADTVPPVELAQAGDKFAPVSGLAIRYRVVGDGQPVLVLLHGFGANAESWAPVTGGLASLGRVVAFDRVGFGLTERPLRWEGTHPYGGPAQVALTLAMIDYLDAGQVILLGHSAGAAIALAMAFDHPDRVAGLVLEAPALEDRNGLLRLLAATPQGRRVAQFVARRAAGRLDELLQSAYHDPSRIADDIRDGYRRPLRAIDWDRGLANLVAAPGLPSVRARLGELAPPVLIITGDDDRWVGTGNTEALAAAIPGAELAIVPDCGHVVHEECPAAFVGAVSAWLKGLP